MQHSLLPRVPAKEAFRGDVIDEIMAVAAPAVEELRERGGSNANLLHVLTGEHPGAWAAINRILQDAHLPSPAHATHEQLWYQDYCAECARQFLAPMSAADRRELVEARGAARHTPVALSAHKGTLGTTLVLLSAGGSPDTTGPKGASPLVQAIFALNVTALKYVVVCGAPLTAYGSGPAQAAAQPCSPLAHIWALTKGPDGQPIEAGKRMLAVMFKYGVADVGFTDHVFFQRAARAAGYSAAQLADRKRRDHWDVKAEECAQAQQSMMKAWDESLES
jgi:hypothetical protein